MRTQREFGAEAFDEVYDGTQRSPLYSEAAGLVGGVRPPARAACLALLLVVCQNSRMWAAW